MSDNVLCARGFLIQVVFGSCDVCHKRKTNLSQKPAGLLQPLQIPDRRLGQQQSLCRLHH